MVKFESNIVLTRRRLLSGVALVPFAAVELVPIISLGSAKANVVEPQRDTLARSSIPALSFPAHSDVALFLPSSIG
jgi:hypothetical protein